MIKSIINIFRTQPVSIKQSGLFTTTATMNWATAKKRIRFSGSKIR